MHLPQAIQGFVNQMSVVSIPIRVQEALNDSKWVESITKEMQALENRSQIWDVMTLPDEKKHVLYK